MQESDKKRASKLARMDTQRGFNKEEEEKSSAYREEKSFSPSKSTKPAGKDHGQVMLAWTLREKKREEMFHSRCISRCVRVSKEKEEKEKQKNDKI